MGIRGARALALAAIAMACGFLGAGAAAIPAAAAPQQSAAVGTAPDCEDAIGAEWTDYLAQTNRVLVPGSATPLFPEGATQCWWYEPGAERVAYFGVGYEPLTADQVAVERARILATGSFAEDPADPTILRAIEREFTNQAEVVDLSFRFHEAGGWWFFVVDSLAVMEEGVEPAQAVAQWSDAIAAELEANVLAAAAPAPEPAPETEPVVPTEPDPVPSAFDAATPSSLSALRTVAETRMTFAEVGACVAAVIVMTALIGVPGRLIDSALGNRYPQWRAAALRAAGPLAGAARAIGSGVARIPRSVVIGIGVLIASVFAAAVDPRLGFNEGSVRLVLSLLAALLIESVLGLLLVGRWLARRGASARLQLRAGSLLVVLASALVSRMAGFDPGFVFGLVVGLLFVAGASAERERDRAVAETAWLFALGVASWLLYSLLVAVGAGESGPVWLAVQELFAGLAVGCLFALVLVLLPLRGVTGGDLWRWNRAAWAVAYGLALLVFAVVVFPLPAAWGEFDGPIVVWIVAVGVYVAAAVAVWAVLVYTPDRVLVGDDEPVDAGSEGLASHRSQE